MARTDRLPLLLLGVLAGATVATALVFGAMGATAGPPLAPELLAAAQQVLPGCGGCNVVVVAKEGGNYTTIGAALEAIGSDLPDATAGSPYLVWVAPGTYDEQVIMKPHVHLQGAGQEATIIRGIGLASPVFPPAQATLHLASNSSVRDLSVRNLDAAGGSAAGTAVLAGASTADTLVANATVSSNGQAFVQAGIAVVEDAVVHLRDVTATAEGGSLSTLAYGLVVTEAGTAVIERGNYTGRGGTERAGIIRGGTADARVEATGVHATGEGAAGTSNGFVGVGDGTAVLRGGVYRGIGGEWAFGIKEEDDGTLLADGVTAIAEGGAEFNFGAWNPGAATVRVGASKIIPGASGAMTCAATYNGNYVLLNPSCQ